MKHVNHFNSFMADVVNLNQTRMDQLENSIGALKAFIENASWEPRIRSFSAQGSWAHKTIIRPVDGKAFDAVAENIPWGEENQHSCETLVFTFYKRTQASLPNGRLTFRFPTHLKRSPNTHARDSSQAVRDLTRVVPKAICFDELNQKREA